MRAEVVDLAERLRASLKAATGKPGRTGKPARPPAKRRSGAGANKTRRKRAA
jgi:hypothetical protein